MTERIYSTDAYANAVDATVVEVDDERRPAELVQGDPRLEGAREVVDVRIGQPGQT